MDDEMMVKEWSLFADAIGASIRFSKANAVDHDNRFKISTGTTEVELIWGNQPQKGRGPYVTFESRIRFKLNAGTTSSLTVRPRDFFSALFTSKKIKSGINELDRSYIFSSNSEGLIYSLNDIFSEFYNKNQYEKFVIETEIITGTPFLTVFIPQLVTTKDKLAFYYDIGLRISKILQTG